MHIPETVKQVLDDLVKTYEIEKLILFGSRAVGDHEPRSDFDIAVSAPSICKSKFSKMRLDIAEARTLYWVSLVHFELTPVALKARIQQQGIIIYERT